MSVTDEYFAVVGDKIKAERDYHSLRLAVLAFFNSYRYTPKELEGTDKTKKLASSAGIEFAGGEWKLKEGNNG